MDCMTIISPTDRGWDEGNFMKMIEIENLIKYYGQVKAVDGVSFSVEKGEFFAFLGVNGAGKSTTISILCGDLPRTSGKVLVAGKDVDECPAEIRRKIGVVFQASALDRPLSEEENLRNRASLYGITGEKFQKKLKELTALLELEDILRRPVGKLSGGQRRRADIARALVHDPELLILDEPTTGLDPQTRKNVWEILDGIRKVRGTTIFLTTHYMEEAADADHVVILDGGKILANATPLELKNTYTGDFITLYHADEERVKLLKIPFERVGEALRIEVKNTAAATELILAHPELFSDYEITKGKMDDVFLNVTGKKPEGSL